MSNPDDNNDNSDNSDNPFCFLKLIIFLIVFVLLCIGFLGFFCKNINYTGNSCFENTTSTNIIYI